MTPPARPRSPRRDPVLDEARGRYLQGRLAYVGGRWPEAMRLLADAWNRCDAEIRPELAGQIAAVLAHLNLADSRGAAAASWARRALDLTRDATIPSGALSFLLCSLAISGRPDEGLALGRSLCGAQATSDRARLDGLFGWACLQLWTDDPAGAQDTLRTAMADHHRDGNLLA